VISITQIIAVMKATLQLLALALVITFTSCSQDESVPNNSLAGENGFEYNRTAYLTDYIYVTQNNDIVLSSKSIPTTGRSVSNVDFAKFSTNSGTLEKRTYNVGSTLTSCTAVGQGIYTNGAIENGLDILGESNAVGGFLRIVNIDRISKKIDIIFEFQRTDGELVAGTYSGAYELTTEL